MILSSSDESNNANISTEEKHFRRRIWIVSGVTLVLPPVTGIFMLSFVGVFPFPEVFYPFADYALIVVALASILAFRFTKNLINHLTNIADARDLSIKHQNQLKRLPLYYFSVLFAYFAIGLVSTLYSLSTLHGFDYKLEKYLLSFLGVIPGGLITALPIFFYLTDTLGHYLAPKGVHISVAPVKMKLIVLGLFIPVLIDTLLIMYFHDRTGYLSAETIGIWFFLIIIAAIGTFMAWGSFRQSLSPFVNALENEQGDHSNVIIVPQSLDELGLLSHRWHQLWLRVLDYEDRLSNSNIALKSDIQQRTNELESERLFINKVLENAKALIIVLDRFGHIVRFNPACEQITGFSFAELKNQPIWDWLIPPEQFESIKTVFSNLTLKGLDSQYENDLMKRDGGRVLIAWNNSTIQNEAGRVQFVISIGIDISERQATQQALEKAKIVAENASQAKSQFLSRMSHELRTPMNAILGFAQLLQTVNHNFTKDQNEFVNEILQAGDHLLSLINEVLDLAKIEEGKFDIHNETTNITKIVDESLSLLMPQAKNNTIALYNNIPEHINYFVNADPLRLKQVIINLLSNAIKYNSNEGSVYIDISKPTQNKLRLSVRDTGPGIPLEKLDKLFIPFERLNNEQNNIVEGAGIGLALSKRLTELMHGDIGINSMPTEGCTFYIDLPYESESVKIDSATITEMKSSVKDTKPDHAYTVLYVEDNPPNLRLVSRALKTRTDIRLITAHTGSLGLDMATGHLPDLILLDINLPGLNGMEILTNLKHNEITRHIPIFAITANAMPHDIEAGKSAGFDEYLTKPLNITLLHELIAKRLPLVDC